MVSRKSAVFLVITFTAAYLRATHSLVTINESQHTPRFSFCPTCRLILFISCSKSHVKLHIINSTSYHNQTLSPYLYDVVVVTSIAECLIQGQALHFSPVGIGQHSHEQILYIADPPRS